jgi:hypothetical protein
VVTVLVSTTAGATFAAPPGNPSIAEIHPYVIEALEYSPDRYTLASLRYDLSKLRAKDLVPAPAPGILDLPRFPEALRARLHADGLDALVEAVGLKTVPPRHQACREAQRPIRRYPYGALIPVVGGDCANAAERTPASVCAPCPALRDLFHLAPPRLPYLRAEGLKTGGREYSEPL